MPGCGPGVAAVENALGRAADVVVGKPSVFMMELIAADWAVSNDEILVIGDSLESDIGMAVSYGCRSFLISKDAQLAAPGMTVVHDISQIRRKIEDIIRSSR